MSSPKILDTLAFENFAHSPESTCAYLYAPCDSGKHTHTDFHEFTLITCDSFTNHYKGKSYHLPKGTLIFFKQDECHSMTKDSERSNHFSFITRADFLQKRFADYFPDSNFQQLDPYIECHLTEQQTRYLIELADALMDNTGASQRGILENLYMLTALSLLLGFEAKKDVPSGNRYYIHSMLSRFNDYSYIHYSVNDIYGDYPMARSALIRLFKQETGKTIVQYHTDKKLEYAAQKLASTKISVTDLCTVLGFTSMSHFAKIFYKKYGTTPKEYQKRHTRYVPPEVRL